MSQCVTRVLQFAAHCAAKFAMELIFSPIYKGNRWYTINLTIRFQAKYVWISHIKFYINLFYDLGYINPKIS